MSKSKYIISNLVFGDIYSRLFLNNHLKSLLDPTNLAAIAEKYEIEMMVFTDHASVKQLSYHPNMVQLNQLLTKHGGKVSSFLFKWPDEKLNKFGHRYALLLETFKQSVTKALAENALLTCWVADLVVAKEFFPRIMRRMEENHDAVFVLPLRATAEPMAQHFLRERGAMVDKDLCALGLECMHPLWVACNWNSPQFTKLPFTLLWSTVGGVMARTFSTTPIVFRPKQEMLASRGMIDGDIPQFFDKPYWCHDWTDAPVIGVEPVVCYYPPFGNRPATAGYVEEFTSSIHESQKPFLKHRCFYPDEKTVQMPETLMNQSDAAVNCILGELHE